MATRRIQIGQIGDYYQDKLKGLVKATTLEWERRVKEETPVDTGNLRNGWQSNIKPLLGEITNRVEYAEPVCFGSNLPPSWDGRWRTKTPSPTGNALGRQTRQGFPELIGKELEQWARRQWGRD